MENYVITIARGFGSGGKEIALKLSKELGIPCYDREILTMASEKSGIDESVFVETDEKLRGSYITNFLRKIPTTQLVEPHEKAFVSDINVFNLQAEIIRSLAKTESCIIVGKCADDILSKCHNVISVYIDAPYYACVESIMKKMNVTRDRAEQLVKKTNRYRSNYYHYYTRGKDWKNPMNYHLTLNSDKIGRDQCVEAIKAYVSIKTKKIY